jgi:LPS export ABC transporter protein LptC
MTFCAREPYKAYMKRFVLAVLLLGGCRDNDITPTATVGYKNIPADQIIVNMEQYITESGRQRALLRGDTAYVFEDSAKAHVKKVNLTLFNENGSERAQLTAREGDFSSTSQAMVARGNVVLVTRGPEPRTIESEELHYDPNQKRIWSDKPTVMRSASGVLRGSGFESDDQFYNSKVRNASGGGTGLKF